MLRSVIQNAFGSKFTTCFRSDVTFNTCVRCGNCSRNISMMHTGSHMLLITVRKLHTKHWINIK